MFTIKKVLMFFQSHENCAQKLKFFFQILLKNYYQFLVTLSPP